MSEFRGARASNAGDDYHELWATRQALRLLADDEGLTALAVEGLGAAEEAQVTSDTWDGVDCTLYYGGADACSAERLRIEQLKYSAADPTTPWTVARLVAGRRRERSVIARLARVWKALSDRRAGLSPPQVVLISNQPVALELLEAVQRAATALPDRRGTRPRAEAPAESRLAHAAGLPPEAFRAFAAGLSFECGAGSRFAGEEKLLRAVSGWTDDDVRLVATTLRQFVRQRMRPEATGELITREALVLGVVGAADIHAVFPCPPEIAVTACPVSRGAVRDAGERLVRGGQHLCLHGGGGVGKTTALQEMARALPAGSHMVTFDCYGASRYLDPSALRHRGSDAFVQLINEIAARLRLPLLLTRRQNSDLPRLFMKRVEHAAAALAAMAPDALLVVAVDAADNAVTAAEARARGEVPFVRDFMGLRRLPTNVRFVVTARTGRLGQLQLPTWFDLVEVKPFSRAETAENVAMMWSAAPEAWLDDFHHLSGGVPRVQSYAFASDGTSPAAALDRLRPSGKSLDDVFREQFRTALDKTGNTGEVARLCAGLVALPRPVPLPDLAAVLGVVEASLIDICLDLAPGIRLHASKAVFADEDFEAFVRDQAARELPEVRQRAATWLLARAGEDGYAALNVAPALAAARRGADLLQLVEQEPAPKAVTDPVQRREAELLRLRLAMGFCRKARNVSRALRFVLIGAEGAKTDAAIIDLLVGNPDLAAWAAAETVGRQILADPDHAWSHGPLLLHKLAVDAHRADAVSVREGRRLVRAWFDASTRELAGSEKRMHRRWPIGPAEAGSSVEAALKLEGPVEALRCLASWKPRRIALEVALSLPGRLIAEGRGGDLELLVGDGHLGPAHALFVLVPLALADREVDTVLLAEGLARVRRRNLQLRAFFDGSYYDDRPSLLEGVLNVVMTACEILTGRGAAQDTVDAILAALLAPEHRPVERRHAHETAKLSLLFRAQTLRDARAGRTSKAADLFVPRAKPPDEGRRRRDTSHDDEHDRSIRELSDAVLPLYAAVASALTARQPDADLDGGLARVVEGLSNAEWRFTRREGFRSLRRSAARSMLVLLAGGHDPRWLMRWATAAHGDWLSGYGPPDDQIVGLLSLRQELHASLLEDLATIAGAARGLRIGADDKARTLVKVARQLKPVSVADASHVFGAAVEVASELDREAMAQLRLLGRLVSRGLGHFPDARATARQLADVAADAAVRLDGQDGFPWRETMEALAQLDLPLALANAARWDVEDLAPLRELLPPLLKAALRIGTLSPARTAALALLVDDDEGVLSDALSLAGRKQDPHLAALAEEAARDLLVRPGNRPDAGIRERLEALGHCGPWGAALRERADFLAALPSYPGPPGSHDEPSSRTGADHIDHAWPAAALLDSAALQSAVAEVLGRAQAEGKYPGVSGVLEAARSHVPPGRRAEHLAAIAGFDQAQTSSALAEAVLATIDAWRTTPAVQAWCRRDLPDVVVRWLPELVRGLSYGNDHLGTALSFIGGSEAECQELVLRGIEVHVGRLGSDTLFGLVGLLGTRLPETDAASLADWYLCRLAGRIPVGEQDQVAPSSSLPQSPDEAVARFLFAYMADRDTRLRWRAAHAVRRLARTGDDAAVGALVAEYDRREDPPFRGAGPFLWIAARLWTVIAWDRVIGEEARYGHLAGPRLLAIALDEGFPHLLLRSFARDACEKLAAASVLVLTPEQSSRLGSVNESPLPWAASRTRARRSLQMAGVSRRFRFDPMDTIPYWYEPMLRAFAHVDEARFLDAAERWIVDVWGYDDGMADADGRQRRRRYADRDWGLHSNRQGSVPTVEPLRTHLEWHAMWCAAGELLATEPLAAQEGEDWYEWDELAYRVRREKLSEPPLWSADLLVPTPLQAGYWRADGRPVPEWAEAVTEADYRTALLPVDRPDYVVVDGHHEIRSRDRRETTSISSALVEPTSARALLRALQTMDDAWDYKLPDEGEDHEINEAPHRLVGWLRRAHGDDGIDEKDPFRGCASLVASRPGQRVRDACALRRDATGKPVWHASGAQQPMFVYEAWGERETDDERRDPAYSVGGHRLLAHKAQLSAFLRAQDLDLIIEVEIRRRGRENRRYSGEEEEAPEGNFDRLYLLGGAGALDAAEGRVGAWTGDRPAA